MQTHYQPYGGASMNMPSVNVYQLVDEQEGRFNSVLTPTVTNIIWQKECEFAKQMIAGNSKLFQVAANNQASLCNAIANVASIGISLNPALAHAYLVPRGDQVCLDVSYKGLVQLAEESGAIEWVQAKLVYQADEYHSNGVDLPPTHSHNPFSPNKGEIIGVYCVARKPGGAYLTEEMDRATLEQIRAAAAPNGPWRYWFGEMSKKAVIKRASKLWGAGSRLNEAVDLLNQQEGNEAPLMTAPPVTKSETINERLEQAKDDGDAVRAVIEAIDSATDLVDLKAAGMQAAALTNSAEKDELRKAYSAKKAEIENNG